MRSNQVLLVAAISLLSLGSYLQAQISPLAIYLAPPSASLKAGESVTFQASVSGTSLTGVTWSLQPPIGTLIDGSYTAPAIISSPQAVTVIASSVVDPYKVASSIVWLAAGAGFTISPSSASLQAGQSVLFSASTAGGLNTSVSWSLTPSIGSVNNGIYTAPATIEKAQTIFLTAVSLTDPAETPQASITLLPSQAMNVSPVQVTLQPSQAQQFTATLRGGTGSVTWSISPNIGSLTPSGQYTAPSAISQQQVITVTATAASDPSVTASATIMLVSAAPTPPTSPTPLTPPQSYNAISDTVPRAEGPAPMLGPANSVYIDPDFGTRILRVSDQNSIPGDPNIDVVQVGGWETPFSADSTKFAIGSADGRTFFYQFDPSNFTTAMMMDPNNPSQPLQLNGIFIGGFSYQDPNILYGMSTGLTNHNLIQYDFSQNTSTVIANIDSFLPAPDQNWSGYSASVYNDYYDVNFVVGAGNYVVVYNKTNNQAALIDLVNSLFQSFNSSTFVPMNGALPAASLVHGIQIDKSGMYLAISYSDSMDSNIYVNLQTGTWTNDPYCHRVTGFANVVANCGNQLNNDSSGFDIANLNAPIQRTFLAQDPNQPNRWDTDAHPSWNNARPNMALPFVADMRLAAPSIFPMRSWDDELIAVATDGSNQVWRFAHMHAVQTGYYYTVPFAHVSPDGRYALINSNWGETLGTASDVQSTYDGAPTDQQRVDVFLIELNQNYPVQPVDGIPPTIPVFPPGIDGNQNISGIINLTALATDNVGVVAMRYAVDGSWQPEVTTAPFTFLLDTTQLSNGYHWIEAYARDAQNNVTLSNIIGFNVNSK
jgi:Big-like domain-containing protein